MTKTYSSAGALSTRSENWLRTTEDFWTVLVHVTYRKLQVLLARPYIWAKLVTVELSSIQQIYSLEIFLT